MRNNQLLMKAYLLDDPDRSANMLLDHSQTFWSYYIQNKVGQIADELIDRDVVKLRDLPDIAFGVRKTDYTIYDREPTVLWGVIGDITLDDEQLAKRYESLQKSLELYSSTRLVLIAEQMTSRHLQSLVSLRSDWMVGADTSSETSYYHSQLDWSFGSITLPHVDYVRHRTSWSNNPSITEVK